MSPESVAERVRSIAQVRGDSAASPEQIREALRATSQVRSWLASSEAALTRALSAQVSFPEKDVADCTRGSQREAMATTDRSKTLESVPAMAHALDNGAVTSGHVDAITKITKSLDDGDQRADCFNGPTSSPPWPRRRRWRSSAAGWRSKRRTSGATTVSIVSNVSGEPSESVPGPTVKACCACPGGSTRSPGPGWCPSSMPRPRRSSPRRRPIPARATRSQQHLQGLALVQLVTGEAPVGRSSRPEYVVVIDSTQPAGAGEPTVDWGLPVEVPYRVLVDLAGEGEVHGVVIRNGVVIHAPGELDLGRSTRLASPTQRRALRALYATCAIPGCSVRYDRCKLHHVVWWRHGGRTDLQNLLPVCVHHHTKIHDAGWDVTLDPDRSLMIRFPDGTVHNTGPPNRRVA